MEERLVDRREGDLEVAKWWKRCLCRGLQIEEKERYRWKSVSIGISKGFYWYNRPIKIGSFYKRPCKTAFSSPMHTFSFFLNESHDSTARIPRFGIHLQNPTIFQYLRFCIRFESFGSGIWFESWDSNHKSWDFDNIVWDSRLGGGLPPGRWFFQNLNHIY